MILKNLILVFLGGGLGSVFRYLIGIWFQSQEFEFPFQTLIVNMLACLILGATIGYFQHYKNTDTQIMLLVATGFCGGLSTFSTFVSDGYQLGFIYKNFINFSLNIFANIMACFLLFACGLKLVEITH